MTDIQLIEVTDKATKDELLDKKIKETRSGLSADRLDMSFGEIISMYERNEIIINPNFQRLFRWDEEQQTRFIESLLLNIPIPPIFVAEINEGENAGKWELVDGLQRVSTVLSFFGELTALPDKNNLILMEGGLIEILEGYTFKSLSLKYQLNIRRAVCRVEVIKWDSKIDMRYELFKRINSYGEPITEQELRNCIFRPQSNRFNDFLKDLADTPKFKELISPTPKQIEQLYLQELVLRFFALYEVAKSNTPAKEKINEVISSYMTSYMKEVIKDELFDYNQSKVLFTQLVELLVPIGKTVFKGTKNMGPFSPNIYDIVMIGVALNLSFYKTLSSDALAKIIANIKDDPEFTNLKGAGIASNSKERVAKRIELTKKFFTSSI